MKKLALAISVILMFMGASLAWGATKISKVPYIISTSGSYALSKNLTYTLTTGDAITVNADNVTIDLMGYSLLGPGAAAGTTNGIHLNGRKNVEIKNGTVSGFTYGIWEESVLSLYHRVIDVRATNNGLGGIVLGSCCNLVKDCIATENGGYGILLFGTGNTVIGNTAADNLSDGLVIGAGSTVQNNTSYTNTAGCTGCKGIFIGGNSMVDGNTADNNTYGNMSCFGSTCTLGVNRY